MGLKAVNYESHCPLLVVNLHDDLEAKMEWVGWASLELSAAVVRKGAATFPFQSRSMLWGAPACSLKLGLLCKGSPSASPWACVCEGALVGGEARARLGSRFCILGRWSRRAHAGSGILTSSRPLTWASRQCFCSRSPLEETAKDA